MNVRDSERLLSEMEAMAKIAEIVGTLPDAAARARVVRWVADYYCVARVAEAPIGGAAEKSGPQGIVAGVATAPPAPPAAASSLVIESFEELAAAAAANSQRDDEADLPTRPGPSRD